MSLPGGLSVEHTPVPGLLVLRLPVHADARGWFKEAWQREKMTALGLPDFGPVQANISFNAARGTTRGVHAEPWDKLVTLASGRVFAAWVDLREGASFGTTFHLELDESVAVFVPRGVGNAYQALADGTAYTYLVNAHWRPGVAYTALHPGDEAAAIPWPVPLASAEVSEKDRANPRLGDVVPVPPRRTLVLGAGGQVGRALLASLPGAQGVDRSDLDVTDDVALGAWDWSAHDVVVNAAAFTGVDAAEADEGRRAAWAANAVAPATLARLAWEHGFTLVHYSTDYVFDGSREEHGEDEPVAPLGVYGQSKAAGDLAVAAAPGAYVLRASWVVGEGRNFVSTMARLAAAGASPEVVDDQVGRLTFAGELARATAHLLRERPAPGTYHVTNAGPAMSWWDVARAVFERCGRDPDDVRATTSEDYAAGRSLAPRPRSSTLRLDKLRATGFEPEDALAALDRYLASGQPERP